ncbi:MAG: hypothetical protein ACRDQ5_06465 [Sciscionella sp.]
MFTRGVLVSAGVIVEDDCSIDYHLCGDQVEFELGGQHGFDLLITEEGLHKLITTASEALAELQAQDQDQPDG